MSVTKNLPHHLTVMVQALSFSSYAATGVLKSRGLARQLAPMGPRLGRVNLAP